MVYFIRHGETDFNLKGIIQGQLDIPLNETGIKQAYETKDKLTNLKIDIIFCSPLIRAKQTAEIINEKLNVPIVYDNRLKEFNAGDKQGIVAKTLTPEEKEEFKIQITENKVLA